ncbi:MAG: (2Fe-2S)-binding protein [Candidatus Muiribacteriota bacterium]
MRLKNHPVLNFEFNKKNKVEFFFNGKKIYGYEGEPIAAALHDNNIKVLRKSPKLNRKRGIFCAIGKCSACLMQVDGIPNIKTCIEPLKKGMKVKYQNKKGNLPGVKNA